MRESLHSHPGRCLALVARSPAARLSTRAWARSVTTSYGYNAAGDLSTIDYSDSTADVTNSFDRRGRTIEVRTSSTSSLILQRRGKFVERSLHRRPALRPHAHQSVRFAPAPLFRFTVPGQSGTTTIIDTNSTAPGPTIYRVRVDE